MTTKFTNGATSYSLRIDREQQSLTRKVGDVLRRAILGGEFKPGQRLVERVLCDLTGVSRTAVREALRMLEAEGLVINIPNQGPSVTTLDRVQVEQIYDVRVVLEARAVELFQQRSTGDDIVALEYNLHGMEEAYSAGDTPRVNKFKSAFYDVLIERCGNAIIAQMLRQILAKITILRHMTMTQTNRTAEAITEIREMYEAIRSGDSANARAACVRHVEAAAKVALAALAEAERAQPPVGAGASIGISGRA